MNGPADQAGLRGGAERPGEVRYADINGDKPADRILVTARGGARAWINKLKPEYFDTIHP
ncbi:hypothetical protein ACFXKF_20410 [Streptomyces scopuliridis]|uniref:hypothetical protein n=1 Tax=Streptomyces scopuliridis TaxID=452529 RepID=UPI0036ACDE5F